MNKRFRELALQAGWSDFESLDERNKKFAELIVKECIENFNEVWYEQGLDIRGADHAEFMAQFIQKFWS